jgi:RNA polymerase sigma factor (sigma-70 family)
MEDVLRALPLFRKESNFTTWIRSIIRNDICTYYRRKAVEQRFTVVSNYSDICTPWDAIDDRLEIERMLDSLPNESWASILRLAVQGMGETEIAVKTHTSYNAVHGRYKRGIGYLKERYA